MTIEAIYTVYCNDCGAWGAEEDTPGYARQVAKREGWQLIMPDEKPAPGQQAKKMGLCPQCWVKRKTEEK